MTGLGRSVAYVCFRGMFCATAQAPAAMIQEMKNAVQGRRLVGAAKIAGSHTRTVNTLIIPASTVAASFGKTENSTPRPQAICPTPVM